MIYSDLQTVIGQVRRGTQFVRQSVVGFLTPGATLPLLGYSQELAGSMLLEADEFFDRALVCFLIRNQFRAEMVSSWANISLYYSNYFSATSFLRLQLNSVTHTDAGGPRYSISPNDARRLQFKVARMSNKYSHTEAWTRYYDLIQGMGWPDSSTVSMLAPSSSAGRFREQHFREETNYKPGVGFREIYQSISRYQREFRGRSSVDLSAPIEGLADDFYCERLAAERLQHIGALFRALRALRIDPEVERSATAAREAIVSRYATNPRDRRFARDVIN